MGTHIGAEAEFTRLRQALRGVESARRLCSTPQGDRGRVSIGWPNSLPKNRPMTGLGAHTGDGDVA